MFFKKNSSQPSKQCSSENFKKIKMNVKGRVQGVGFRYTVKLIADKLGITGNIWNETDGSVMIEAVAKPQIMDEFIEIIQSSPSPYSLVKKVLITPDPTINNSSDFNILTPK